MAAARGREGFTGIRFEAEQVRVRAQGEADAAAIQAEGQKRSAVIRAEGEAQAIQIVGAAQAASLQARGAAVAAHPEAITLVTAERWSGTLPQTLVSERGILPLLNLNAITPAVTVPPSASPGPSVGQ